MKTNARPRESRSEPASGTHIRIKLWPLDRADDFQGVALSRADRKLPIRRQSPGPGRRRKSERRLSLVFVRRRRRSTANRTDIQNDKISFRWLARPIPIAAAAERSTILASCVPAILRKAARRKADRKPQ